MKFIAIIAIFVALLYAYYAYNWAQPTVTRKAKVIAKRTEHSGREWGSTSASGTHSYYCTFEFENGQRHEYRVSWRKFALLVEQDVGSLDTKGKLFWIFRSPRGSVRPPSAAWRGAVCAIVGAFPWAGLVALVYGFPVPFAGRLTGPAAVLPSLYAVIFFGILWGGFVVLGLVGAGAGLIGQLVNRRNQRTADVLCLVLALAASGACEVLLAVLVELK